MTDLTYYLISGALVLVVLLGINLMSKVRTSRLGNFAGIVAMALIIVLSLIRTGQTGDIAIWACLAAVSALSLVCAARVKMIEMPQVVALLNGFGGLASALAAWVAIRDGGNPDAFNITTSGLAIAVGMVTLTGSLVAAGKLARLIPQRSVRLPLHTPISAVLIAAMAVLVALSVRLNPLWVFIASALFGVVFSIRIGGADMPIAISLLNSLSGVAAGIAGIAVSDAVLISVGGIVGASGLLLTQIMCRAMGRSLLSILLGGSGARHAHAAHAEAEAPAEHLQEAEETLSLPEIARAAKDVIVVPGYGMALAQAQEEVRSLADAFEERGARVRFAVHPVAGRMPGHMNVLLCEAGVPYDQLYEMDDINADFPDCDLAIVVGANDTVNPAANTAEDTPIYGMPILDVALAKHLAIFNLDKKPGYAGVLNPLYERSGVFFVEGNAKETVARFTENLLA